MISASLVENGPVILENIFEVCQYIFALLLLSPLGRGRCPSFKQIESLFPSMLCTKFG